MTALKTVSMYLRAAKTEAEEAGESTDGMANSVSELREELLSLTGGRVDIMIDNDTFKSTYQIMKDLSEVWNDLSDISRANILEQIGGKRNATAVTSLITNFQTAEESLIAARNATGSAIAENEKYLDSIAGKIAVIQAKFETLSSSVLDSEVVKIVLSVAEGLLDIANMLSEIHMLMPAITAAVIAVVNSMQAVKTGNIVNQVIALKDVVKDAKNAGDDSEVQEAKELVETVSKLSKQKKEMVKVQLQNAVAAKRLTDEDRKLLLVSLGLDEATEDAVISLTGMRGELAAVKGAAKNTAKEIKEFSTVLGVAFKNNWISILLEIASFIVTFIPWGDIIKSADEKMEELENRMLELSDNVKRTQDEFKSLYSSAEEIAPRFEQLAKGVNAFGENVSLTDSEYEEFVELNNKLAELFPEINMGVDANGNAMLLLKQRENLQIRK